MDWWFKKILITFHKINIQAQYVADTTATYDKCKVALFYLFLCIAVFWRKITLLEAFSTILLVRSA